MLSLRPAVKQNWCSDAISWSLLPFRSVAFPRDPSTAAIPLLEPSFGRLRQNRDGDSNQRGKWRDGLVNLFGPPSGCLLPHPYFPPIWSSVAPRALCPQHPSSVPTRPLLLPPLTRPPEGHNTHIVGLLLIRPNYALSGLAPKPSRSQNPDVPCWVSGWDSHQLRARRALS